jgi:hypothetical protein
MSKLDPALQQALTAWRIKLSHAQSGEYPSLSASEVEASCASVIVTYKDSIAPLRDAGLETGFDSGGVVSGLIEFRNIEKLAALPDVVRIVQEPKVKIGLDGTIKEMRIPWKVPPTTPWPGKGAGVIVAVIDTGIDIFHESFRKADGTTRILGPGRDGWRRPACRIHADPRPRLQHKPDQPGPDRRSTVP